MRTLLGIAFVVLCAHSHAATTIGACGAVLAKPGTYELAGDLSCAGIAITVIASGVSLNLNQHEVRCIRQDGRLDVGVFLTGVEKAHVTGGSISGCDVGVLMQAVRDSKVTGLMLADNILDPFVAQGAGIALLGSNNNTVTGNIANQNEIGIFVFSSRGNRVTGNVANNNFRIEPSPWPSFGIGIALSAFSEDNVVSGNETNWNSDTGIVANGASRNIVRGNDAKENGFYGVGAFTRTDLGGPTPVDNLIQNNTAIGNGRADLLEALFDPGASPRETLDTVCNNEWQDNSFDSEIAPANCID